MESGFLEQLHCWNHAVCVVPRSSRKYIIESWGTPVVHNNFQLSSGYVGRLFGYDEFRLVWMPGMNQHVGTLTNISRVISV